MGWKVNWGEFDRMERALIEGADQATEIAAKAAQTKARNKAPSPSHPGPFATGATEASIYVSGPKGSDYGECAARAVGLNPSAQILDESKPQILGEGQSQSVIGVATGHAEFIEKGRFSPKSGSYEAPRPFLEPAVLASESTLLRELKRVMKRAGFK